MGWMSIHHTRWYRSRSSCRRSRGSRCNCSLWPGRHTGSRGCTVRSRSRPRWTRSGRPWSPCRSSHTGKSWRHPRTSLRSGMVPTVTNNKVLTRSNIFIFIFHLDGDMVWQRHATIIQWLIVKWNVGFNPIDSDSSRGYPPDFNPIKSNEDENFQSSLIRFNPIKTKWGWTFRSNPTGFNPIKPNKNFHSSPIRSNLIQ